MAARRGSMLETAAPCRVYELRRLLLTEMRGHFAVAFHRSRCSDRCLICILVLMRSVLSGSFTYSLSCRPCLFELTCLCAVPATDRSSGSGFPFSARARARRRARARAFVAPGPEPELCFRFPWADVSSFGLAVTWAWVRSASHVRIRPACVNGVAGRVLLSLLVASVLSPMLGSLPRRHFRSGIADVPLATAHDLEEALAAADRAWPLWRATDVEKRSAILHKTADLLRERARSAR